ncbi:class I SAM-dependent methyltransferase [Deinococcus maricopensis]|uniref:Methyltransferase type 11 n=1 Tax=Deinococcus maricopensis (strain DSM 21211 / LMG 22137 / NRRL B-23946 / LB-34) TaxID=709986 RepID=E8U9L7_DEIML|nr:methyltransferase domain-containing protein [Deinococcus maricopensis]ADV67756.1 Methyltransferase type 11 [Deinococcus maricopensis DSM 21211]
MALSERDALLSTRLGRAWPHAALLDALRLSGHADVLDVGAGTGDLLRTLRAAGHTGRLEGLDTAPHGTVRAGDAHALPYPEGTFDAVLLVRVFMHLQDPAAALREAERVRRPGGQVIVAAHGPAHLQALRHSAGEIPDAHDTLLEHLRALGAAPRSQVLTWSVTLTRTDASTLLPGVTFDPRALPATWPDTLSLVVHTLQP